MLQDFRLFFRNERSNEIERLRYSVYWELKLYIGFKENSLGQSSANNFNIGFIQ